MYMICKGNETKRGITQATPPIIHVFKILKERLIDYLNEKRNFVKCVRSSINTVSSEVIEGDFRFYDMVVPINGQNGYQNQSSLYATALLLPHESIDAFSNVIKKIVNTKETTREKKDSGVHAKIIHDYKVCSNIPTACIYRSSQDSQIVLPSECNDYFSKNGDTFALSLRLLSGKKGQSNVHFIYINDDFFKPYIYEKLDDDQAGGTKRSQRNKMNSPPKVLKTKTKRKIVYNGRTYVVRIKDRYKYILVQKEPVYLRDIRGQYRNVLA
jgi:hypothetical protein